MIKSRAVNLIHAASGCLRVLVYAANQCLWPPVCQACSACITDTSQGLCNVCWQNLSDSLKQDYCRRCGRIVSPFGIVAGRCGHCMNESLPYDGICRAGLYETTLKSLILKCKFRDSPELAGRLGQMLRQSVETSGFADQIDYFIPVPLHWIRRLGRGYNQAYLLARHLSGLAPVSTDLRRIRHTRHQWQLSSDAQRKKNVRGAFAVYHDHPFDGKTVCLVDDIATTQATLAECCRVLRLAKVKAVYAAVVAMARQNDRISP